MSKEDLIPSTAEGGYKLTTEDCVKGAKAAAKANKWNHDVRRAVQKMLTGNYGTDDDGNPLTGAAALAVAAMEKAILKQDVEAMKFLRDTAGDKPTDKTEIEQKTVRIRLTRHSAEETEKEPDDDDEC